MNDPLIDLLREARRRERLRAAYYRSLAAAASDQGDAEAVERLNELHADEQHHLSRVTARLLELGHPLPELDAGPPAVPPIESWEADARRGEEAEVAFYEEALGRIIPDARTRAILEEILDSERHHAQALRGKWMSA